MSTNDMKHDIRIKKLLFVDNEIGVKNDEIGGYNSNVMKSSWLRKKYHRIMTCFCCSASIHPLSQNH